MAASTGRRKNKAHQRRNTAAAILLTLLALFSAFLTFAPAMHLPFSVPGWDTVFAWVGLRSDAAALKSPLSVHFLDVGQGDSTLIRTEKATALIDAGESANAAAILSYLKEMKIERLDYVIATHPHSDHIGAMAEIVRTIPVSYVIMPKLAKNNTPTTQTYLKLLQAVKDSGAQTIAAEPGKTIALGDAQMEILSPFVQADNLNNMSVAVRLTYGQRSFLFMGDAEKPLEEQLLSNGEPVKADVIKIGHHGSNTATGADFLASVAPKAAVISCGKGNSYGHPHQETLALLQQSGVLCLRTDESGRIVFMTDGKTLRFESEKGKGDSISV